MAFADARVTPLAAIVLAGGKPDAVSRLQPQRPNKAFVRIDGVALVERTIRGLRAAATVGEIVVVAPEAVDDPALGSADRRVAAGDRIGTSIANGLAGFTPDVPVLVTASDLPLVGGVAVDDFVRGALARDADLAYACVAKAVHDAKYGASVPHTWARMRDGIYCGGPMILVKPRAIPRLLDVLDRLAAARRAPILLSAVFGWDVLFRFAFGMLSIDAAEARASRILGAPAVAVPCAYPEIAVNVDRATDVALAERLVRHPSID